MQADVPDIAGKFQRRRTGRRRRLRGPTGRGAGRRQAIPLRLPSVVVGGRWQGRPTARRPTALPAPRLTDVWPPADRAVAVLRKTQAHQQQRRQKRTRS